MPDHVAAPEDTIRRARDRIDVFAQYVDTEEACTDLEALAVLADVLLAERQQQAEEYEWLLGSRDHWQLLAERNVAEKVELREALEAFLTEMDNYFDPDYFGDDFKAALDQLRAAAVRDPAAPYIYTECSNHSGEIEYPDSGCAKCREENTVKVVGGGRNV